ncbi:MAG: TIGR02147 family protein [bacterium]
MAQKNTNIDLFNYFDYRQFLKDWYEEQKKNTRGFSFRYFSEKAGFGSPNFLKRVIDGDRNLTESSLKAVINGVGLNKQESDFFTKLVHYNQAETHDEKNTYYHQVITSQKFSQLKPIEKDQYEFCSTWYHPIVRELIVSPDFDGTPEWIAKTVRPSITPGLAQKSIELLERLHFINKQKNGKWLQTDPVVTTGSEAASLISLNYHKNVLDLVKHQLTRTHPMERDVSALTLGVKKGRLTQLKKKIQEFRKDILKMVSEDDAPEEVVLLSMQLLPVSHRKTKKVSNKRPL